MAGDSTFLVISYDIESQFCGGNYYSENYFARRGAVNLGKLQGNYDCQWLFSNWPGSTVEVRIGDSYLEQTDYCAESYVEIRAGYNDSGQLIARRCGEISGFTAASNSLVMRLRRISNEETDTTEEEQDEYEEMASDLESKKEPNFAFSFVYSESSIINPLLTISFIHTTVKSLAAIRLTKTSICQANYSITLTDGTRKTNELHGWSWLKTQLVNCASLSANKQMWTSCFWTTTVQRLVWIRKTQYTTWNLKWTPCQTTKTTTSSRMSRQFWRTTLCMDQDSKWTGANEQHNKWKTKKLQKQESILTLQVFSTVAENWLRHMTRKF